MGQGVVLKTIGNLRVGHTFRGRVCSSPGGELAVLQPRDIGEGGELRTSEVVSVDLSVLKPAQLLQAGDVLLVGRGRICAAVYRDQLAPHCIASGALFVISLKESAPISADFLVVYLNSHEGQLAISRLGSHTTTTFLSLSNLEELEIPVPEAGIKESLVALSHSRQRFLHLSARKAAIIDSVIGREFKQIR